MPYLAKDQKDVLRKNVMRVTNPGALNFLFTLCYCKSFKEHMKYETLHVLKRDFVIEPKHNKLINHLRTQLADLFTVGDIYAAAALAWEEFYARVGRVYEQKKIRANGDVEEIVELVNEIEAEAKEEVGAK